MAKQKGVAPRQSSDGMSIVAAMLVGGVVTVAIGFFLYLWNPFNQPKVTPTPSPQETVTVHPKTQASSTPKPNYEFYDLLPDQKITGLPKQALNDGANAINPNVTPDVVVGNKAKNTKATSATAATKPNSATATTADLTGKETMTEKDSQALAKNKITSNEDTTGKTYILQINSYTNADDADRRRARVLMAGVDAQIVKKQLPDGLIVYQVVSRPMANQVQVAEAQSRLQENGIDSLIVEQRRNN